MSISERLRAVDLYDDHDMHTHAPLFIEAADTIDALASALRLLVTDVADYPAWQRPCHALDVARAALARLEKSDG